VCCLLFTDWCSFIISDQGVELLTKDDDDDDDDDDNGDDDDDDDGDGDDDNDDDGDDENSSQNSSQIHQKFITNSSQLLRHITRQQHRQEVTGRSDDQPNAYRNGQAPAPLCGTT